MKSLSLLKSPLSAQLIPTFKQTERRLLSVFMSVLNIIPEFRGHILELVEYRGGKTSEFKSFMEPTFDLLNGPAVRPDGLLTCERGTKKWAALIEAKSEKNKIRPEQIADYCELGKLIDVDAIISISNEFAGEAGTFPYTMNFKRQKGRKIYHLSWPQIKSEMVLFLEGNHRLNSAELMILEEAIRFFDWKDSGVHNFTEMSMSWPDFVESANTVIGFNTATSGVAEIVKDWQQERRDLCIQLNQQVSGGVEAYFPRALRNDPVERRKIIREKLANDYKLEAVYQLRGSKSFFRVYADLRACRITYVYEFLPPAGKQIRAVSTWLGRMVREHQGSEFGVKVDWTGRNPHSFYSSSDIARHPEIIIPQKKMDIKTISIVVGKQDTRRFKSRKLFIQDIESEGQKMTSLINKLGLV